MAEMTTRDEQESELRSKLLKRLGIAGVMVIVLLGVLAYFDRISGQREEAQPKVFTKPVPVAPKKEVSQPVKPAEPELPAAETKPEQQASGEAQTPVTTVTETTVPTTVRPEAESGKTPVAVAKPAPATGGKPVATAKPVAGVKPVPEATSAPVTVSSSKPQPEAAPVKPDATPSAAPPRLLSGYAVQAGVFTNARSAEELHVKLAMNGIPSTLEARVYVGPFKTRAEAEAARKKLKELGIEGMLIAPPARRK
ncbi:MAG: cell division protein FtsN [Betaproteobacteria bacterium ADurb.Bin341]|nr:MAG: cell division protein FtsN [Betaproteobacteria bacterium ADurb.Bin341]